MYSRQRAVLEEAGCIVPETNARAALRRRRARPAAPRAGARRRCERCRAVALVTYSHEAARRRRAHARARRGAARRGRAGAASSRSATPAPASSGRSRAPVTIVPGPDGRDTLEDKVAASIDAADRRRCADVDAAVLHAQDCIAARAAARVRDAGAARDVVRTVHHVDDFTSQVLMDCQRAAILEPDVVLVVSEDVAARSCAADYGVAADGRPERRRRWRGSPPHRARRAAELRRAVGAGGPAAAAVGRRDRAAQGQRHPGAGAGPC